MSIQTFKAAMEAAGLDKQSAAIAASTVIATIEKELATNSLIALKGIGRLEVVANKLGGRKSPIGGAAATGIPVRVRFVVARSLKNKIASSYRTGQPS
jgi:nucleoid DNA-binding protein